MLAGTRNSLSRSSSHFSVWMLNSIVRDALVTSVMCVESLVSCHTIPHDGGLALVGNADAGDVARPKMRTPKRLGGHRHLRSPDLAGVVFNPARAREDLSKLALSDSDDGSVMINDDRARARGALVEGDDVRHGSGS